MLHCLEGVLEFCILKQRGEQSKKDDSKTSAKHKVKSEFEPTCKEKIFFEQTIIDHSDDEEPDEKELKRRKVHENEVVDLPSQHWVEPVVSFELHNTQDLQLDLPITPKSFKFWSFVKVANVPSTNNGVDHFILLLSLKHMKLQYKIWNACKVTSIKITGPIETDNFPNV
ncbi:unnamed protein product [Lactuca saligna]|uniref:Uncharacterized protein n=1 Tax=Lactuca saligna TaxID=75948 RepID=A0AA36ENY1_LACSI|nr:unnamed protein product [Lactuca saligna]